MEELLLEIRENSRIIKAVVIVLGIVAAALLVYKFIVKPKIGCRGEYDEYECGESEDIFAE